MFVEWTQLICRSGWQNPAQLALAKRAKRRQYKAYGAAGRVLSVALKAVPDAADRLHRSQVRRSASDGIWPAPTAGVINI
ncbi:hypothetical protein YWS52_36250 [Chitiniphilus shinanonensis]